MKIDSLRHNRATLSGIAIALLAFGLSLWKCQFGLDLYDEPFYLIPSFKLFSLGDWIFRDGIFNGPRHFELLNYWLIRPLIPYSVLALRLAAVIFHSILIAGLTWVAFQKRWGKTAGIIFAICIAFDFFLTGTWSHNTWCRNALVLHHLMLMLASLQSERRNFFLVGAGVMMAVATIAYNTMLATLLGVLFFWALARKIWGKARASGSLSYASGAAAILGPYLLFLLSPGTRAHWLHALQATESQAEYGAGLLPIKLQIIVGYSLTRPELWAALVLAYGLLSGTFESKLPQWAKRWHVSFRRLWPALLTFCVITILLRGGSKIFRGEQHASDWLVASLLSLGLASIAILSLRAFYLREIEKLVLAAATAAAALIWGLSSCCGGGTLAWPMETIIIPFLALGFGLSNVTRECRGARAGITLWLLLLVTASVVSKIQRTYGDVPVKYCTATFSSPPLQGIKSSPGRVEAVEALGKAVGSEDYILAYPRMPAAFYFGKVRSAVDTLFIDLGLRRSLQEESLQAMKTRHRMASKIVEARMNNWVWGTSEKTLAALPANDPYLKFSRCAKGEMTASREEFTVYQVRPEAVENCLNNLKRRLPLSLRKASQTLVKK